MNREDIDLDRLFDEELPFKPLTEGLGFHHEEKKQAELGTLKARTRDLEEGFKARKERALKDARVHSKPEMGDLAPFYKEETPKPVEMEISTSKAPSSKEASALERLGAFFLDIAIISASLCLTLVFVSLASGINLITLYQTLEGPDLMANIMPLGALFYLFYFSFFDKTAFSTLGKRAFAIRVKSTEDEERMSMGQSFSRALFLAVTLGLGSVANLHNKFSNTLVVKR